MDESNLSFGINDEEHTPYQVSRKRTYRLIRGLSILSLILFIIVLVLSVYVSKYKSQVENNNNTNTNPIIPTSAPTSIPTSAPTPPPTNTSKYAKIAAEVMATRDTSIDPCDDFYQHACGGWLKTTKIPDDQTRWTRTFNVIAEQNNAMLRTIAEQDWPLIGTFYKSCMNMDILNQLDLSPIQSYLDMITNITTLDDVMRVSATLVREIGTSPFMSIGVGVDSREPEHYLLSIGQGGRTFSPLDYYYGPKNKTESLVNYTQTIFIMINNSLPLPDASTQARALVDFEMSIVNFTLPPDQLRDPVKTYNNKTLQQLQEFAPLPWSIYLTTLGFSINDTFVLNLDVPEYTQKLSTLISKTSIDTLRIYLKWRLIYATSTSLSSRFADAHFEYFGKEINGQEKPTPRWKKCTTNTNKYLPDVMGRYYVEKSFPGASKDVARDMIHALKQAFLTNLPNLDWMDDAKNVTRENARTKLSQMVDLIGYPSAWTDYSDVYIRRSTYLDNMIALNKLDWITNNVQRLNKTVDKNIWQMSPPTVNAYYDPTLNTINFPAGIIQPSFFDINYPAAMNFGGIGMVMGHELTHGFDDEGRQYDGTGRLRPWWPDEVIKKFEIRAKCISEQYSSYVVPSINETINGNLTLGENIADNGGIRQSFVAYQSYAKNHPDEPIHPTITNEQLFFLAYGQSWCTLAKDTYLHTQLQTDPHSPSFARVNGPLQNFDAFAKTFNCSLNTRMNPVKKCLLW